MVAIKTINSIVRVSCREADVMPIDAVFCCLLCLNSEACGAQRRLKFCRPFNAETWQLCAIWLLCQSSRATAVLLHGGEVVRYFNKSKSSNDSEHVDHLAT
jgi:hypothetical protein